MSGCEATGAVRREENTVTGEVSAVRREENTATGEVSAVKRGNKSVHTRITPTNGVGAKKKWFHVFLWRKSKL